jgi:hypothetical protein
MATDRNSEGEKLDSACKAVARLLIYLKLHYAAGGAGLEDQADKLNESSSLS